MAAGLLFNCDLYFPVEAVCAEWACLPHHQSSHSYCETFSHLGAVLSRTLPEKLHWCNLKLSALLKGSPVTANVETCAGHTFFVLFS